MRAKTMIVAAGCDAHAKQVLVIVHGRNDAGQKYQKLEVFLGGVAWVEEIFVFRADRPIVMFAGAVDSFKRLFVLQTQSRDGLPAASSSPW